MIRPSVDFIPNEFRGFSVGDRFHQTVADRLYHNKPPAWCRRETEGDEVGAVAVATIRPPDERPAT